MIAVLGRPRVYRIEPDGPLAPGGLAVEIALALGQESAAVELVGSIGDDPEGDRVVIELSRAGVGHAALLRDPATRTPGLRAMVVQRPLPRLEAADVELGLRYLAECRVLVVAEALDPAALAEALAAAEYHGAAVVLVAPAGSIDPETLGDSVTLLERPAADGITTEEEATGPGDEATGPGDEATFAGFVAEYALRLDRGETPSQAFSAALGEGAWEPSPG